MAPHLQSEDRSASSVSLSTASSAPGPKASLLRDFDWCGGPSVPLPATAATTAAAADSPVGLLRDFDPFCPPATAETTNAATRDGAVPPAAELLRDFGGGSSSSFPSPGAADAAAVRPTETEAGEFDLLGKEDLEANAAAESFASNPPPRRGFKGLGEAARKTGRAVAGASLVAAGGVMFFTPVPLCDTVLMASGVSVLSSEFPAVGKAVDGAKGRAARWIDSLPDEDEDGGDKKDGKREEKKEVDGEDEDEEGKNGGDPRSGGGGSEDGAAVAAAATLTASSSTGTLVGSERPVRAVPAAARSLKQRSVRLAREHIRPHLDKDPGEVAAEVAAEATRGLRDAAKKFRGSVAGVGGRYANFVDGVRGADNTKAGENDTAQKAKTERTVEDVPTFRPFRPFQRAARVSL